MTLNLPQIEQALDNDRVKVLMKNGNLWLVRRNGKTQTWKRDPLRFRIPIKFGFRSYGEITERSYAENGLEPAGDIVIL